MDIVKIIAVALISLTAIILLRQTKPELALVLTIGVSVVVVAMVADELFDIVYAFYDLSENAGVDKQSVGCVVKIIGIGYLAEFCNNICVDADCKSVGDKILFAAKIAIMLTALPILTNLFGILKELLI